MKLFLYSMYLPFALMRKIFAIMGALIAGGLAIVSSTVPQATAQAMN